MPCVLYIFALLTFYPMCSKAGDITSEVVCIEVIANQSYNCEDLGLQEIPDCVPTTTEILDFSFNSLFALYNTTFSDLIKLKYLDLTRCHINWIYEDIFIKNIYLDTIVLIGNPIIYIADMAFAGPITLKNIFLQQTSINHLTYFPTYNLYKLETLSFGNNFLPSIELHENGFTENLQILDFQSNRIQKIFAKDLEPLKMAHNYSLILKGNAIDYIEPNAFNSSNLHSLDLAGCAVNVDMSVLLSGLIGLTTKILKIGTFEDVDNKDITPTSLNGLCNISVQELNLQYSSFSNLSNSTFSCLNKIQKLDLTHCDLDGIPSINRQNLLRELVLNTNKIQSLCDIKADNFPLLTHLHISGNTENLKVETGCLKSLSNLQYLDLSHSGVESYSCCKELTMGLRNLKHLNLSFNYEKKIIEQAFSESENLEVLDFSNTWISFSGSLSPFSNLKFLRVLNVSYCKINGSNDSLLQGLQSLVFLNMKGNSFQAGIIQNNNLFQNALHLEVLILSSCGLTTIEEKAFHKLEKLRHIDLSHNKLTVFTSYAFKDLSHIYLNFAFNSIKTISFYLVKNVTKNSVINLSYNPLDCTCENFQFISWYKQNMEKIEDNTNTVCGSPLPTVGKELSRLEISCGLSGVQIFLIIIAIVLVIIGVVLVIKCYRKTLYYDI
ncbi:CD180 antigen [Discoglossus pictus]